MSSALTRGRLGLGLFEREEQSHFAFDAFEAPVTFFSGRARGGSRRSNGMRHPDGVDWGGRDKHLDPHKEARHGDVYLTREPINDLERDAAMPPLQPFRHGAGGQAEAGRDDILGGFQAAGEEIGPLPFKDHLKGL
jgi:hypothetical protein